MKVRTFINPNKSSMDLNAKLDAVIEKMKEKGSITNAEAIALRKAGDKKK